MRIIIQNLKMCSEVVITLGVGESLAEPWIIYEAMYFFVRKLSLAFERVKSKIFHL